MAHIKLGWKMRDKVSGIVGIAVARIVYLNGCIQYCIVPPFAPGALEVSSFYIDAIQLVKVDDGFLTVVPKQKKKTTKALSRRTYGANLKPKTYGKGMY